MGSRTEASGSTLLPPGRLCSPPYPTGGRGSPHAHTTVLNSPSASAQACGSLWVSRWVFQPPAAFPVDCTRAWFWEAVRRVPGKPRSDQPDGLLDGVRVRRIDSSLMTQNEPRARTAPAPWFLKLALTVSGKGFGGTFTLLEPSFCRAVLSPHPHAPSHPDFSVAPPGYGLAAPWPAPPPLPNSRVRCALTSKSRESPPGGCFPGLCPPTTALNHRTKMNLLPAAPHFPPQRYGLPVQPPCSQVSWFSLSQNTAGAGWLRSSRFLSHTSGGWEVRDQGAAWFGVWWVLAPDSP